jgi:LytS/YehU family sensor histidine kinase
MFRLQIIVGNLLIIIQATDSHSWLKLLNSKLSLASGDHESNQFSENNAWRESPLVEQTWFLITMAFAFVAFVSIICMWKVSKIKKREAEKTEIYKRANDLKFQALHAQLSPHLIFNCLNAINGHILTANISKASEFLTQFSKLMRKILENSTDQWVRLDWEVETLDLYLVMEGLRFEKKFFYKIDVDDEIVPSAISIPSMIIQPYVEKAIWNGLINRQTRDGLITIRFSKDKWSLKCIIEDNGFGGFAGEENKNKSKTNDQSFRTEISTERLELIDENCSSEIHDIHDSKGRPAGTRVIITLSTREPSSRC